MIRVVHMVQNFHFGGMERIIAELVRRTNAKEFEMHVLVLQFFGHFAEGLDTYATLHCADPMSKLSMLRPTALAELLTRINPDIVHLHSGVWFKGSLAARMAGVPAVIYTDHGRQNPDPWHFRLLDRIASRRTDVAVAVSSALAQHMSQHVVADPHRIQVIRNGVDTDHYAPAAATGALRRELGIAPDRPIIGSIGRLEAIKGYEVMVNAFVHLLKNPPAGPRPALVIVGDGAERRTLEAIAHETAIHDDIYFLGWRNDTLNCLHEFSLFTMSSHSEGTSVSLLEAMSAGLCPVVTKVGGNPAVLGNDLQHRLIPPADPEALAAAWRDALDNTEQRLDDAHRARQRILAHFSLQTMVQEYEMLYRTVLARRRTAELPVQVPVSR